MKHVHLAMWILVVGLISVTASATGAADDRGRGAAYPSVGAQSGKPASGPVSNDQKGNPVDQGVAPQGEKPTRDADTLVYTPPLRGFPAGREGGGTRGDDCTVGNELLMLSVLVPEDHAGQTVQDQPSLYWYLSKSTPCPIELTIIDDHTIQPLLEARIPPPVQPGIQRLRLTDYGIRLSPGVPYKWSVSLVRDPDHWSKNIIASGAIARIELPTALGSKLTQAGKARAPHIYAEAGLWYDALTALAELIETAPYDPGLRKQRASLLEQVGLPEIAASDMRSSAAN